jgi:hypothetical protein
MDATVIIFLLRLAGGAVLLAFVGTVGWFIYQDMQLMVRTMAQAEQAQGRLLVVASESGVPAVGTVYPLLTVTQIGRASSNTVVLDDGYSSNRHALITRRSGQWWLEDLESRNGTLLNGVGLAETAVVSSGDQITIGTVQFEIEL